jgi:hypothetical protein
MSTIAKALMKTFCGTRGARLFEMQSRLMKLLNVTKSTRQILSLLFSLAKRTEMKSRMWAELERKFMAIYRMFIPKERNIFEVGAIGSTLFFVLSVLSLMALGFDFNDHVIQLVCVASAALGFLVFMAIQSG